MMARIVRARLAALFGMMKKGDTRWQKSMEDHPDKISMDGLYREMEFLDIKKRLESYAPFYSHSFTGGSKRKPYSFLWF
jgi:hypothetical protein